MSASHAFSPFKHSFTLRSVLCIHDQPNAVVLVTALCSIPGRQGTVQAWVQLHFLSQVSSFENKVTFVGLREAPHSVGTAPREAEAEQAPE